MENQKIPIAVAVTGASGAIYARRLLEGLDGDEIMLTVTPDGFAVMKHELGLPGSLEDFSAMTLCPQTRAKYFHHQDFFSPIAGGSCAVSALVVVPCSMNTLGKVGWGLCDNLVTRAASNMLKERKKLILVTRETPLSLIHIENMQRVTRAGGIILPACPGFYHRPQSLDDAVDFVVDKILRMLDRPGILPDWGSRP